MNTIFPDGFAIMVITLLVLPALAISAFCRKGILPIFFLFLLLISDMLLPVSGFSNSLGFFSWKGRVVEKDTGVPIEGAVVIRSWTRRWPTPAGGGSAYFAVRESLSDKDGKFSVPTKPLTVSIPGLYEVSENHSIAYKPGYKLFYSGKRSSVIEMEKIPSSYCIRHEEAEAAKSMNFSYDFYQTKLLQEIVSKEEETIKGLPRYVAGVFYHELNDHMGLDSGIAIDREGSVYITNRHTIRKFSKAGDLLRKKESSRPHQGIEFDSEGNLYAFIIDYIMKIDPFHLSPLSFMSIGKESEIPGFNSFYPVQFAIGRDGRIFAINKPTGNPSESKNIFIFEKNGRLAGEYKAAEKLIRPGEGSLQLIDIAADEKGNLFVGYSFSNPVWDAELDRYSFRNGILKLDHAMTEVFDKRVALKGKQLRSITAGSDGEIFLATEDCLYMGDKNSNFTLKETLSGRELGRVDIVKIKADREGHQLYLIEGRYGRLLRYDLKKGIFPNKG